MLPGQEALLPSGITAEEGVAIEQLCKGYAWGHRPSHWRGAELDRGPGVCVGSCVTDSRQLYQPGRLEALFLPLVASLATQEPIYTVSQFRGAGQTPEFL